jgi:hypothetical protein
MAVLLSTPTHPPGRRIHVASDLAPAGLGCGYENARCSCQREEVSGRTSDWRRKQCEAIIVLAAMLLTIRTVRHPATDLGFLLHKHPDHVHTREFPFGMATAVYPEASYDACTAAILLDVDSRGIEGSGEGAWRGLAGRDQPWPPANSTSGVRATRSAGRSSA